MQLLSLEVNCLYIYIVFSIINFVFEIHSYQILPRICDIKYTIHNIFSKGKLTFYRVILNFCYVKQMKWYTILVIYTDIDKYQHKKLEGIFYWMIMNVDLKRLSPKTNKNKKPWNTR